LWPVSTRPAGEEIGALRAVGVHDGDHEIGALAAQRLGLCLHGRDRRQEFQVFRTRHARRVVVRGSGQADAHAVEREDGALLDAGQRAAVGRAQVCGIDRKRRLHHAFEEHALAEVEFVIARREYVRREHVGQRHDMGALVDPRHQRGRQGVAAMRQNDMPAIGARPGALCLDHGGKPGEAAAAPAVRHQRVTHEIDVVRQDEGDLCGIRPRVYRRGDDGREHAERGEEAAA
jgi:hypothetical protein